MQQSTPFKYSPVNGMRCANATNSRADYAGATTWHFNPWTGDMRAAADVTLDPTGLLIVPPGESLLAAKANDVQHAALKRLVALKAIKEVLESDHLTEVQRVAIAQFYNENKESAWAQARAAIA